MPRFVTLKLRRQWSTEIGQIGKGAAALNTGWSKFVVNNLSQADLGIHWNQIVVNTRSIVVQWQDFCLRIQLSLRVYSTSAGSVVSLCSVLMHNCSTLYCNCIVLFEHIIVQDWAKDSAPEADDKGYFNTTLPVLLIQMIEQNVINICLSLSIIAAI